MKNLKSLLTALMIAGSLTAFSSPIETKVYRSITANYDLSFTKIVVEDGIDLVVYENATSNMQFDGKKEDIAKVDWKVKNGVLYLRSKRGSLKNKVLVTLDVSDLKSISINGNSMVRSLGILSTPQLDVYMKGECFVAIRNLGDINVINTDETEMDVRESSGNLSIR